MIMTSPNLVPLHRRNARRVKSHLCAWLIGGGTYVMGLLVYSCISVVAVNQGTPSAQEVADLEQRIAVINTERQSIRNELEEAHQLLAATQRVSRRPDWSILMAVVAENRGDDVVLREMSVKPLFQAGDDCHEMRIAGYGRTQSAVSTLALGMEQIGIFSQVTVRDSRREPFGNGVAIAFDIVCEITGSEAPSP